MAEAQQTQQPEQPIAEERAAVTSQPQPDPKPETDGPVSEREWLKRKSQERRKARAQKAEAPNPEATEQPQEQTTEPSQQEIPSEAEASEDSSQEPQTAAEGEQPEAETAYFPETVPELIEALGVESKDFMQGMTMPVKVNGVEQTVSLEELAQSYSSESERGRLGREIAEQRKAFEAETAKQSQQWQERFQQVDTYLHLLHGSLEMGMSDQELAQLRQSDPLAYNEAYIERQQKRDRLNELLQQRELLRQQADQERQKEVGNYRRQQQEQLLAWKGTPESVQTFEGEIKKALPDYGFSPQEVDQFVQNFDVRQLKVLSDAIAYNQLKGQEKPIRQRMNQLPKLVKPGPKRSGAQLQSDKVLAARNRLNSNQDVASGVALLRERRGGKSRRAATRTRNYDGSQP